jgi:hypothetical protein
MGKAKPKITAPPPLSKIELQKIAGGSSLIYAVFFAKFSYFLIVSETD